MLGARCLLILAAISGFGGVLVGAFGAHGLPNHLAKQGFEPDAVEKKMANVETGVRYQMYHTLAILAIALAPLASAKRAPRVACWMFVVGIVLFSFGLYGMSIFDLKIHWSVVPIGGTFFLIGWGFLLGAAVCSKQDHCPA